MKVLTFLFIFCLSLTVFAKGMSYEVASRVYENGKMISEMTVLASEGERASVEINPQNRQADDYRRVRVEINEVSHKKIEDALSVKFNFKNNSKNNKMDGSTYLVVANGAETLAFAKHDKKSDKKYEVRVAVMRHPLRY